VKCFNSYHVTGSEADTMVDFKAIITLFALALFGVAFLWSVGELGAHLAKRLSLKLVGRKKTWWNREFKGTWLWASPIGFALAALISSSLLRWLVVVLSVLGCLFALVFRLTRHRDEI
jgi:hypothetical protein